MLRVVQVCNVGNIVGGTAACAWSVVRSLPDCRHVLFFRSAPTAETKDAFEACKGVEQVAYKRTITEQELNAVQPDLVIMHNTAGRVVQVPQGVRTLQFAHSKTNLANADQRVCCSHWLANQLGKVDDQVCWQGVPLAETTSERKVRKTSEDTLIVGRICTPTLRKWPEELISFYEEMAPLFPQVQWEFVGCPHEMQSLLFEACQSKAVFHEANWKARQHLGRWDVLLYHHPTLTESFGRTVAETMRAGAVPVVDNKGGFKEQVNGDRGYLCQYPAEFQLALESLHDPQHWGQLSAAGREYANETFSLSAFRDRLLEVLAPC